MEDNVDRKMALSILLDEFRKNVPYAKHISELDSKSKTWMVLFADYALDNLEFIKARTKEAKIARETPSKWPKVRP